MNMKVKSQRFLGVVAVFVIAVSFGVTYVSALVYGIHHHVPIDLKKGVEQLVEVSISKECVYEIGVGFKSRKEDLSEVKSVFGKLTNLNLPAKFDLELIEKESKLVLQQVSFGGKGLIFRYGPFPVKFIAFNTKLKNGEYFLRVNTTELESSMEVFDAFLFVDVPPKINC